MLEDAPFSELIDEDLGLIELRRRYAGESATTRRRAAEWVYYQSVAQEALARWTGELPELDWGAVEALAIDASFAPALLAVGSVEYQLGRVEDAMCLFRQLLDLPAETEDLPEIVDKAGTFLSDCGDLPNATALFDEAVRRHPEVALFHSALGYCHGKIGNHALAVEFARKANELEPQNHEYLSDLGWALIEAGAFDEAEETLHAAIAAAPSDEDTMAYGNLEYLRKIRG